MSRLQFKSHPTDSYRQTSNSRFIWLLFDLFVFRDRWRVIQVQFQALSFALLFGHPTKNDLIGLPVMSINLASYTYLFTLPFHDSDICHFPSYLVCLFLIRPFSFTVNCLSS
ncbi:unnamed protein product [Dicrocoelium dendriticum]|nr:unnamed protein product [Dicrocoelium dendriticum]